MITSVAGFILFCVAIYTLTKIQETHKNVEMLRKENQLLKDFVEIRFDDIEIAIKEFRYEFEELPQYKAVKEYEESKNWMDHHDELKQQGY